jgi:hypothetical protein
MSKNEFKQYHNLEIYCSLDLPILFPKYTTNRVILFLNTKIPKQVLRSLGGDGSDVAKKAKIIGICS